MSLKRRQVVFPAFRIVLPECPELLGRNQKFCRHSVTQNLFLTMGISVAVRDPGLANPDMAKFMNQCEKARTQRVAVIHKDDRSILINNREPTEFLNVERPAMVPKITLTHNENPQGFNTLD